MRAKFEKSILLASLFLFIKAGKIKRKVKYKLLIIKLK